MGSLFPAVDKKKAPPEMQKTLLCSSGGRTRTDDLWVMSPTSYQLLHPAVYIMLTIFEGARNHIWPGGPAKKEKTAENTRE